MKLLRHILLSPFYAYALCFVLAVFFVGWVCSWRVWE